MNRWVRAINTTLIIHFYAMIHLVSNFSMELLTRPSLGGKQLRILIEQSVISTLIDDSISGGRKRHTAKAHDLGHTHRVKRYNCEQ